MSIISISLDFLEPTIKSWDFQRPLVVGVSGLQGSGKSYLSENLTLQLQSRYPHLNVCNTSIDDFYLTHEEQKALATKYPGCSLITSGRGLPGTHSLALLQEVVSKVQKKAKGYKIPRYDKSRFQGEGDRYDESQWTSVDQPVDVLIFEGWFVGFKSIPDLATAWERGIETSENDRIKQMMTGIDFSQVQLINELLRKYEKLWEIFDKFIYIATDSLLNVYTWRLEQEKNLISAKGTGMTDQQVEAFVDRYYPLYKLYYGQMIENGLVKGGNLRLSIGVDREVKEKIVF